jgi:fucose permease
MFSTWLSRGPEVQTALQLDTAQMGWLVMVFPLGGLVGMVYATGLTQRLGSTRMALLGNGLAAASLAGLGWSVPAGQVAASVVLLFTMGLPLALMDYLGNYEGTAVDKASRHSLFPAIHSAFGLGMMGAAALCSALITRGYGLAANYGAVAVCCMALSLWAASVFPRRDASPAAPTPSLSEPQAQPSADAPSGWAVWREARSLRIALIGFSFIMAEISAGIWAPIAMTRSGISQADAASALGLLWVLVTLGRALGGFVVDRLGRPATVRLSALVAACGVAIFMLDAWLHMPYVGLVLLGGGMAMGFPLSVAAMGEEPRGAPARINMIISVVYLASMTVGPALGGVGQWVGLYPAFSIPLVFLLVSAAMSGVTRSARP